MYVYKYTAIDKWEKRVNRSIIASSEQEALDQLNRQNYNVLAIQCKGKKLALLEMLKNVRDTLFFRIDEKALLLFTRELSLMLKVGIPIDKAFHSLAGYQDDEKLRRVLDDVRIDIMKGLSMSQSVDKHKRVFPIIFRALVEVGEHTGKLTDILDELSDYQEKELMTKKRVISALYYPAFIMGSTIIIITAMMIFYLPEFTGSLEGMHVELPLMTRVLMSIVGIFQSPATITTILVSLAISAYIYYNFTRTMVGRFFVDNLILKIPVLGNLLLLLKLTRFARTFALMYRSGIQIDRVLEVSKDIMENEPLKDLVEQCKAEILSGESIAESFRNKRYIPPMMKSFLTLGEETEEITVAMEKVAEIYDDQIANSVDSLINLLEPVFMALVAFVVGFVVIALFLPIYSLISNIGM